MKAMKINLSSRMQDYEEGIFQTLNEMVLEKKAKGQTVYNMTVGTPDFEVAPYIREAVAKAALDPQNYKYSLGDMPELTDAVIDRFRKRYGVNDLKASEIASVYGSQEGIAHVAFPFCNPGDIVLVPDPGYPVFSMGPALTGANITTYPLYESKDYILDFNDIPEDVAKAAKIIIVSYPLNPVCAVAPRSFYEDLVKWAEKYNVIVIHDNAYSDIIYDGNEGISFLSIPGAREVGVEFYSLSKSYNLTGARISFLIGNEEIISAFKRFRSQIDYGIFKIVQYAAIAALKNGDEDVKKQCGIYQDRRDKLCQGMREIGWNIPDSKGSMFVWAPIPDSYASSVDFVKDLFEKTGLLCTPGSSFGAGGDRHVRFALTLSVDEITKAIEAVKSSGIFG